MFVNDCCEKNLRNHWDGAHMIIYLRGRINKMNDWLRHFLSFKIKIYVAGKFLHLTTAHGFWRSNSGTTLPFLQQNIHNFSSSNSKLNNNLKDLSLVQCRSDDGHGKLFLYSFRHLVASVVMRFSISKEMVNTRF